jgi:hypothetical protein
MKTDEKSWKDEKNGRKISKEIATTIEFNSFFEQELPKFFAHRDSFYKNIEENRELLKEYSVEYILFKAEELLLKLESYRSKTPNQAVFFSAYNSINRLFFELCNLCENIKLANEGKFKNPLEYILDCAINLSTACNVLSDSINMHFMGEEEGLLYRPVSLITHKYPMAAEAVIHNLLSRVPREDLGWHLNVSFGFYDAFLTHKIGVHNYRQLVAHKPYMWQALFHETGHEIANTIIRRKTKHYHMIDEWIKDEYLDEIIQQDEIKVEREIKEVILYLFESFSDYFAYKIGFFGDYDNYFNAIWKYISEKKRPFSRSYLDRGILIYSIEKFPKERYISIPIVKNYFSHLTSYLKKNNPSLCEIITTKYLPDFIDKGMFEEDAVFGPGIFTRLFKLKHISMPQKNKINEIQTRIIENEEIGLKDYDYAPHILLYAFILLDIEKPISTRVSDKNDVDVICYNVINSLFKMRIEQLNLITQDTKKDWSLTPEEVIEQDDEQ